MDEKRIDKLLQSKKVKRLIKGLRVPESSKYRPEVTRMWPKVQKTLAEKLFEKNLRLWDAIWDDGIEDEYVQGVKLAAYRELVQNPGIVREAADDYFEEHGLELVRDLTETDLKSLKTAMCKNWGVGEDAFERAIRDDYMMSPSRIKTIYRTEHHRAQNAGVLDVSKRIGRKYKQWICLADERSCEICSAMADKVVPIDEPFRYNGGKEVIECMIPNDSHPNCRCAMITLNDDDLTEEMRQQLVADGYINEDNENEYNEGEFWTPRMDYPVKENAQFSDPLRILRMYRMSAKFSDRPAMSVSQDDINALKTVPKDRILSELVTMLLGVPEPSRAFNMMLESGALAVILPEITRLVGVEQSPIYHPEGNVWTHTMLALDSVPVKRRTATLMLGILFHDIGKAYIASSDGSSYYHDYTGSIHVRNIMKNRLTDDEDFIHAIALLVQYHMWMHNFDTVNEKGKRTIMRKLIASGVNVPELIELHRADLVSRGADPDDVDALVATAYDYYDAMSVEPVKPLITGAHLLELGYKPGPVLSIVLNELYSRQLNGEFSTVEDGLKLLSELDIDGELVVEPEPVRLNYRCPKGSVEPDSFKCPEKGSEARKILDTVKQLHSVRAAGHKAIRRELRGMFRDRSKFEITHRMKKVGSIMEKTQRKGVKDPSKFDDISGLRVVTRDAAATQEAIKIIKEKFKDRIKPGTEDNYIENPKETGYHAYHVTVLDKNGEPHEIQVRTARFNEWAEKYHALYKGEEWTKDIDKQRAFDYFRKMADVIDALDNGRQVKDVPKCPEDLQKWRLCV